MSNSKGALPYDDSVKKYIQIQSYLNVNTNGSNSRKNLAEMRPCTRDDYERVNSGEVWDDLQE